ncbi:MAG: asparagine synthase (glutamine-hydrolyzing) [Candidatus Caldarchaeales archaeon]|jgi:asparagine synthase (glutamine-hydrolysing)
MCGIAGIYTQTSELILRYQSVFSEIKRLLKHRGPDDEGVEILPDKGLGLVHTRLSVIDLSPAGRQPMWDEERTVAILFNGEIYNFIELRRELIEYGYQFRSRSDTEVLVLGYKAWGIEGLLRKINGMFAFALWDNVRNQLFLARDRLGEKPLYYFWDPGTRTLLFASEIKAILVWPFVRRTVSPEGLHLYLAFGYIPSPYTIFQNIFKLSPGHLLRYDGDSPRIERYWGIENLGRWRASQREYQEAVREGLIRAVARRLVSDVPLGAFLSGGVDSSVVVGLMSRLQSEPVRTFTSAFDVGPRSPKYNVDAEAAEVVARAFSTQHTCFVVKMENIMDLLYRVIWNMDEPHANPTLIATYLLAHFIKSRGISVILSGDGGDELFGGYSRYLADFQVGLLRRAPRWMRSALRSFLQRAQGKSLRKFLKALEKAEMIPGTGEWYLSWWEIFPSDERLRLIDRSWCEAWETPYRLVDQVISQVDAPTSQDLLAYLDLTLWVADESNMRVDKMCMAHALEVRAPFLDHEIVERAMAIPFREKVGLWKEKRLLKEAFSDLLPEIVLHRPKWGWFSPVYYWVKDAIWEEASRLIRHLSETGIFSKEAVRYTEKEIAIHYPHRIWSMVVLAIWHEIFIENNKIEIEKW